MIVAGDRRRVVITGMGAVTSLGVSVPEVWNAVIEGRSGIGYIRQFDSRAFPVPIGSEVDLAKVGLADCNDLPPGRTIRFGLHAALEAQRDAALNGAIEPARCGVISGSSAFPVIEDRLDSLGVLMSGGQWDFPAYLDYCRRRPETLAQSDAASISGKIARKLGFSGASTTVQAACASATQAIGLAFKKIANGELDLAIAGGADSMLSMMCVAGFTLLGALSRRWTSPAQASRPFDRTRDGFVAGEGAAMLVLEDLESARRRGARIYAELAGYGSSGDAYRFTDGHPEGLGIAMSMQRALEDSNLRPDEIAYINAHGTSTPINDRCETRAIRQVFGRHADRLPVSSVKSELGHLLCAAGAIELVITVLAVHSGVLPPTINLSHPDPDCDLDYVPNSRRNADVPAAISNSCGFGGQNGSLVIRRWEAGPKPKPRSSVKPRSSAGSSERVVVTGVGVISPLGTTARKHYLRFLAGGSATKPGTSGQYPEEAHVSAFDRRRHISNRMLRKILTRASGFATVAAGQALRDSGLRKGQDGLAGFGLHIGSPGLDQDFDVFLNGLRVSTRDGAFDASLFARRGMAMIDPLFLVKSLPNSGLCGISIEFGITGPNINVMNGSISALQAIAAACADIRRGEITGALAGGYDSLFQLEVAAAHAVAGRIKTAGEGAAVLVLEREDRAIARQARIYAEIVGDGESCDADRSLQTAAMSAIERGRFSNVDIVFGDSGVPTGIAALENCRVASVTPVAGCCGVAGAAFSAVHACLASYGYACGGKGKRERSLVWSEEAGRSAALAVQPWEARG
jgi:3-oxoacyl-[acyl-carrier-protein] synthase II